MGDMPILADIQRDRAEVRTEATRVGRQYARRSALNPTAQLGVAAQQMGAVVTIPAARALEGGSPFILPSPWPTNEPAVALRDAAGLARD